MDEIVSEILLDMGDDANKKYYTRAYQWALNFFREINVNYSSLYKESYVTLNSIHAGEYPEDLVKLMSVGIYLNGEFWSFTKKSDLSILATGENGAYDIEKREGVNIPSKGHRFGRNAHNIAYWQEDEENCRFFVRSFAYNNEYKYWDDNTHKFKREKSVVIRYKTTGLNCDSDICLPFEVKDYVVSAVVYKLMLRRIPIKWEIDEKNRQLAEVGRHEMNYQRLIYEPHNFWEVKDAIFTTLNTTARR